MRVRRYPCILKKQKTKTKTERKRGQKNPRGGVGEKEKIASNKMNNYFY